MQIVKPVSMDIDLYKSIWPFKYRYLTYTQENIGILVYYLSAFISPPDLYVYNLTFGFVFVLC